MIKAEFVAKSGPIAYAATCGICALPTFAMTLISVHEASARPIAVAMLTFLIGTAVWLRGFEIRIAAGALTYTTLLGGARTVALAEIARTEFETGPARRGSGFYRLVLVPKTASDAAPLTLNLIVFRGRDIGQLFELLEAHGIAIEAKAKKLQTRM